ncbi:MAG: hypothetical protein IM552_05170 [Chitinophagaceae bacterium]|nr:hypothetical protein [Chitinophagaceae bacterium]
MKNLILLCLFSFSQSLGSGQELKNGDTGKTKIFIIGVVHIENECRNADSLFNILQDIKPDLILSETDTLSGYFKSDYTLIEPPGWYKMARKINVGKKMPPEMEVLYKYLNYDSTIKCFPFDMPILNRKDNVVVNNNKEKEWVAIVNKAYSENKITANLLPHFGLYLEYNNYYVSILNKSYSDINRKVVSDSIRSFMALEKEVNPKLIEILPELVKLEEWQKKNSREWLHRNEVMAKNVIRFTELSKSKKTVILTGLLHKYILKDLLSSSNTDGKYELVEYFEK